MINKKQLKDRQHQRQKGNGTLILINECVCQILDLSRGGISFGCKRENNFPESWTADILDDSGVHIFDLPIKTVWTEKQVSPSSIHTVKVGAKFAKNLDNDQQSALERLLTTLSVKQSS